MGFWTSVQPGIFGFSPSYVEEGWRKPILMHLGCEADAGMPVGLWCSTVDAKLWLATRRISLLVSIEVGLDPGN